MHHFWRVVQVKDGYLSEDMDWCGDLLLYAQRFDFYDNPFYAYRQQRNGSITAGKAEKLISDKLYMCEKGYRQALKLKDRDKTALVASYYAYEYSVLLGVSSGVKNRELLGRVRNLQPLLGYDISKKVQKVKVERYTISGGSFKEEWKEKKRIDAVRILESGVMSKTNSKPQQIVDSILDKNNIKYEREKGIKYYSIDNYLTDSNLMIEVQGDYWHVNPIKFQNKINKLQYERIPKDKAKHTYTKNQYGIEILYLWESDIYNNILLCEKLILEYIKRNGNLENYHSFNYHLDENGELMLRNNLIIPYQDMKANQYKKLYEAS